MKNVIYNGEEYTLTGRVAQKETAGTNSAALIEIKKFDETDPTLTKWVSPDEMYIIRSHSDEDSIIKLIETKAKQHGTATRRKISRTSK